MKLLWNQALGKSSLSISLFYSSTFLSQLNPLQRYNAYFPIHTNQDSVLTQPLALLMEITKYHSVAKPNDHFWVLNDSATSTLLIRPPRNTTVLLLLPTYLASLSQVSFLASFPPLIWTLLFLLFLFSWSYILFSKTIRYYQLQSYNLGVDLSVGPQIYSQTRQ